MPNRAPDEAGEQKDLFSFYEQAKSGEAVSDPLDFALLFY
jgi:hypothetical protein